MPDNAIATCVDSAPEGQHSGSHHIDDRDTDDRPTIWRGLVTMAELTDLTPGDRWFSATAPS